MNSHSHFHSSQFLMTTTDLLIRDISHKWNHVTWSSVSDIFLIHSSANGHLKCFYFLAIKNSAMNIHVQVFVFNYFVYISKSRNAESYSDYTCNLLRNQRNAFHSGCTILHSYKQCTKVPIFPLSHQHYFF